MHKHIPSECCHMCLKLDSMQSNVKTKRFSFSHYEKKKSELFIHIKCWKNGDKKDDAISNKMQNALNKST